MNHQPTILVIEDDAAIRRGLVDSLTYAGYRAVECSDGAAAIDCICENRPDLVLLDVMLPNRGGFDILDDIRRTSATLPVIMVTAKGAEHDRVNGLRGGADDYVVKPFSPKELLARIEAVLRRSPERTDDLDSISIDGRSVDFKRREVVFDDSSHAQLSEREADILHYLAANHGRAVDRDELLHRVWGLNPRGITTRTVDMHIARLREKLRDSDFDGQFILTVRGKGYMLSEKVKRGETRRAAE